MSHASPARLPGLDTLRALAIVAVICYHISGRLPYRLASVAHFGWMGVDLFFVLSGYLIGSQLLKPCIAGEPLRLRDFYRRRLFRILPAYLVVLAVYFLVPGFREQTGISPLWEFLTFTENLFVDYGKNQAFSHVWSLCVEEHFYLVLPVLAIWLTRRPAFWKTASLLAFCVALGICIRAWTLIHVLRPLSGTEDGFGLAYIERIYYPTCTHCDGLLAGLSLALVRLFRPGWWAAASRRGHGLFVAGSGLIGLSMWLFAHRFESVTGPAAVGTIAGYPLLSAGIGMLVASSISRNGWLARTHIPGARLVATLAFSLYLSHKIILHLDQEHLPRIVNAGLYPQLLLYAVTCTAAAAVLYLYVERPFLILRDALGRRTDGQTIPHAGIDAMVEPAL